MFLCENRSRSDRSVQSPLMNMRQTMNNELSSVSRSSAVVQSHLSQDRRGGRWLTIMVLCMVALVLPISCGSGGEAAQPPSSSSVLAPSTAPELTTLSHRLDSQLVVAASVQPLKASTLLDMQPLSVSGTPILGPASITTQFGFLVSASGTALAPYAIRPSDRAGAEVVITAQRIALGIVGHHPWVIDVEAVDREQFFDDASSHPNFAFIVTRVTELLAQFPNRILDLQAAPEIYSGVHPLVDAVLGNIVPGVEQWAGGLSTPCGAAQSTSTFSVQAGLNGNAILVNPRGVFYGIKETDSAGAVKLFLAPPKESFVQLWPPGLTPPTATCEPVNSGSTQFEARAYELSIDLSTAGGMGMVSNGLYGLLHVAWAALPYMGVPIGVLPVDKVALVMGLVNFLSSTSAGSVALNALMSLVLSSSPLDFASQAGDWFDLYWNDFVGWLWGHGVQVASSSIQGSFTQGLTAMLQNLAAMLAVVNELGPYVTGTLATLGEGPLTFCVSNNNGTVSTTCPPPCVADPHFTYAPTQAVVSQAITFDPSSTAIQGTGCFTPVYEWIFDDFDGSNAVDISTGAAQIPVSHTFSQAGIHAATLRVRLGSSIFSTVHYVSVGNVGLSNLGFESGTTGSWTLATFGVGAPSTTYPSHSTVVTPGFDPIIPSLTTVWSGQYALRIEDSGGGCYASSATRTFQVPSGLQSLTFAWAAVLEEPPNLHPSTALPFFDIQVVDNTTGLTIYSVHHYTNEPGYPWQSVSGANGNSWYYANWQPVTVDLSGVQGHSISISAIGADCSWCGHGGYVYLDGVDNQ